MLRPLPLKKTVLLIVPEFPPNDSIGGRRWAKFAKYLAQSGVAVKVIAFLPPKNAGKKSWTKDISHPDIEVFYLPSGYPSILLSTSKNLFWRVLKKISSIVVEIYDGGIIQDKAIFFNVR